MTTAALSYKNFHEQTNAAYDKALAENGKPKEKRFDGSKNLDAVVEAWKQKLPFDSEQAKGPFPARIFAILPQKQAELKQGLSTNPADPKNSFLKTCDDLSNQIMEQIIDKVGVFGSDAIKFDKQFEQQLDGATKRLKNIQRAETANPHLKDIRLRMQGVGIESVYQKLEVAIKQIKEARGYLEQIVEMNRVFAAGIGNALKSYFAFAKVAAEKLSEIKETFTAKELKNLIHQNRDLLSRLAKMAMPVFILFDNLNGVIPGHSDAYTLSPENFEILDQATKPHVEPKQEVIEDLHAKVQKPTETSIERIKDPSNEIIKEKIIDMDETETQTHGCIAFKDGMMTRFFDTMDGIIDLAVDAHYSTAS